MASQTRPFLMTGAALASAAAVIAATPVITPGITAAQTSISQAGVTLATFADVLSIPADEWVASYFQGYGGIVGPNNPQPGNPSETGGLEPWASACDTQTGPGCYVAGVSGVAYLALDALFNGNGEGWDNNEDWSVGAINYLFEGGVPGAGLEWVLQESVGAANPILAVAITLLFTGAQLTTVVFDNAVQLLGDAALNLPLVGDYIYGALNAYLGPASLDPNFQGYTPGLSGVLNYAIDVLIGAAPSPPAAAAAILATAPAAAAAALATTTVEKAVEVAETPAATVEAAPTAPAGGAPETGAAETAAVAADKAAATAEATTAEPTGAPAESGSTTEATTETAGTATEATSETTAESTVTKPVAGATAETTAAPESAPADSTAKTRKRPLRDAVEKVTAGIGSVLKGTKAGAADKAADKPAEQAPADGSDSAS